MYQIIHDPSLSANQVHVNDKLEHQCQLDQKKTFVPFWATLVSRSVDKCTASYKSYSRGFSSRVRRNTRKQLGSNTLVDQPDPRDCVKYRFVRFEGLHTECDLNPLEQDSDLVVTHRHVCWTVYAIGSPEHQFLCLPQDIPTRPL